MKPRLFVPLVVVGLLVLGIMAIACGDDGGQSDEDAIRNNLQESITACNQGDFERAAEFVTATGPDCPPRGAPNKVEVLSVIINGDEGIVEFDRIDNEGETHEIIAVFRKEDGRWLMHTFSPR